MSYQNYEELESSPLVEKKAEETREEPPQVNYVRYMAGFGSLAVAGLFLISATNTSSPASTTVTTQSKFGRTKLTNFAAYDSANKYLMFEDFIKKYNKVYKDDVEKQEKFENFVKFLSLVDTRNLKEHDLAGSGTHGITIFADLSEEDFHQRYLGYRPVESSGLKKEKAEAPKPKEGTTSADWSDIYTTAVKDQGYCGSCWAFSATEQIESDAIRAGYLTTSDELSPQQIVSCDTHDWGCNGGNTETAYEYIISAGGLESNDDYPYTSYMGKTGTCSVGTDFEVTVSKYYGLYSSSGDDTTAKETAMEDYVLSTGPLSVCLDASEWSSYTGGIVTSCGTDVDHCVQVVGVNTEEGWWKVRNSWGTSWGVDGYIYLKTGANTCYITYDPTFVKPATV